MAKEIHGKPYNLSDRQRRRLAVKAKEVSFSLRKKFASIATPETMMRWYRELVAKKYDSSQSTKSRKVGRPSTKKEIVKLVLRMAKENERWGYTRIRDALYNLGHEIGRGTVSNILRDHGIEPAPERGPRTTWADFLKRHWHVMAATDFFTVEICTLKGIVRYHVHFVIKLATREVQISGISPVANGFWMEQIARNLTDCFDGFLNGCQFLIQDRDPLFTSAFRRILDEVGIEFVRLPRRSPNLNAYAERFVKSIKHECLAQMIFFSEKSLRYAIKEYADHYHHERNHQGLDSKITHPKFQSGVCDIDDSSHTGAIIRHERIGGLLNFYYRDAA